MSRPTRQEGLLRGIAVTAVCLIIGRAFGLGRELLVASHFGPSAATDAVYASLTFLTTVITILMMTAPNAISAALYRTQRTQDERAAVIWSALVPWAAVLIGVALFLLAFPMQLGALLTDRRDDAELARALVPSLRLAAVALVFQGLLLPLLAVANGEGWHTPVAILSMGFPIGTVVGLLAFERLLGPTSVLAGVVASSVLQCLLVVGLFFRHKMRPRWLGLRESSRQFVAVAGTAAPIVVGVVLLKLDMPINVRIASHLDAGDVFLLSLAGMLVNVPMSVANSSLGQPVVPELVRASSRGDRARFVSIFTRTSEMAALFVIPFAVMFVVDPATLVEILFRRGRFGADAVERVATIVRVWGGASWILVQCIYSEDALTAAAKERAVALVRAVFIVVMTCGVLTGARIAGLPGLIGAFVAASALRYVVVTVLLGRILEARLATLWAPVGKLLVAAVCAAAAAWAARQALDGAPPFARLVAEGACTALTLVAVGHLARIESVRLVLSRVRGVQLPQPTEGTPPS